MDTIGILDNRCATYCKLEQYDLARRDAKQMIKTAKDDERVRVYCPPGSVSPSHQLLGIHAMWQGSSPRRQARKGSGDLCLWLEDAPQ